MENGFVYRCPKQCKIHKHCFIIKTQNPIKQPLAVLHKCKDAKKDILLIIGEEHPP